jgi:DNA repair exonuclease SbcCD nuclease subunit
VGVSSREELLERVRRAKEEELDIKWGEVLDPGSIRVVYATDLHLWHNNPTNRTGNYAQDVLEKIGHIVRFAASEYADLLIFGGDLTDRVEIPVWIANAFTALLQPYLAGGGNVLLCVGEHDTYGRNANEYVRGLLGNLELYGIALQGQVRVAYRAQHDQGLWKSTYDFPSGQLNVAAIPAPSNEAQLGPSLASLAEVQGADLVCLHHAVTPDDVQWAHAHPSDLPKMENSVILCGHVHVPWTYENIYAPGSVGRTEYTEAGRTPQFLLITKVGEAIEVTAHNLPCRDDAFVVPTQRRSLARKVGEARKKLFGRAREQEGSGRIDLASHLEARIREEDEDIQCAARECFLEARMGGKP